VNLSATLDSISNRPELAPLHNTFIELAESVLNARLHERHLEDFDTYGMAPGSGSFTLLPYVTEVLGARPAGAREDIVFRPRDEVLAARANGSREVLACIVGRAVEVSILTATPIELRAKIKIATAANGGTNWVLENFPNVYLFGCLVELFDHLRDDAQTAHYKTRFEEALALVNSTMTNKSTQQFARVRSVR
jgi:hypothetical protein